MEASMSGKSRYGGGFGSGNGPCAANTAGEETRSRAAITAATVATEAAVQASWVQYVQNLVSEQIAVIHDGVIATLGELINEQLDRLFDEADKLLRRDGNFSRSCSPGLMTSGAPLEITAWLDAEAKIGRDKLALGAHDFALAALEVFVSV
jgi:hypothetical protein